MPCSCEGMDTVDLYKERDKTKQLTDFLCRSRSILLRLVEEIKSSPIYDHLDSDLKKKIEHERELQLEHKIEEIEEKELLPKKNELAELERKMSIIAKLGGKIEGSEILLKSTNLKAEIEKLEHMSEREILGL